MSKYHDDDTVASDPGGVSLCEHKLRRFHPEMFTWWARFLARFPLWFPVHWLGTSARWREIIEEHVLLGDSRAAIVVAVRPLVVAAYTDELDCVALLRFDAWVADEYGLRVGDRLLTVNTYATAAHEPDARDLMLGPRQHGQYVNFWPIIAEFVADNLERVAARRAAIDDEEWERARSMGERRLANGPAVFRDGAPLSSRIPADARV